MEPEVDDDFIAQQPTADQRAAVSREMTNILHKRIDGINFKFKMRRMGLEHDVQGASDTRYVDYASKQLADDSKPVGSGSGAPTGRGAHSSRMGHGERSFFRSAGMKSVRGALAGPSAGTDVDGRLKRRGSAAAMEDLSSDKRAEKAKRLRVLKTFLHDAEAKLMGRMVDAFTFSMRNGVPVQPFELPLKPILQYAGETIKCPYSERHFKRYLTNARSCNMLKHLFWYVFCYCFQANTQDLQERLLQLVSRDYVVLLDLVKKNKDYFFETYPYAMAFAVCTGYHFFVPGSRSRFTRAWRLEVYLLVCRVLCGMDVCAVTVQRMQETLYPEESPGDAEKDGAVKARRLRRRQPASPLAKTKLEPPKDGWDDLITESWGQRLGALRQLPQELSLPSLDQSNLQLSGPGAREPDSPAIVPTSDAASTTSSMGNAEPAVPELANKVPQGRQLRLSFSASSISGLVKRYLGTNRGVGKQTVTLKRTAPVPWSRVGGVDTFHPELAPNRSARARLLQEQHGARVQEFRSASKLHRSKLRHELRTIGTQKKEVLQGGVSCVSKFCLDLSDSKAEAQQKQDRKRRTREQRVAAHLASLPAPSLLTTHFAPSGAPLYPRTASAGEDGSGQGIRLRRFSGARSMGTGVVLSERRSPSGRRTPGRR